MQNIVVRLFTVLFLLAAALPAEVVIQRYDGPLPARQTPDPQTLLDLPPAISTALDRAERPTTFYILPAFKIDSTNPMGETTAIAIRNEDDAVNTITIQLFEANTAVNPITLMNALLPKEIWTINLRSETGPFRRTSAVSFAAGAVFWPAPARSPPITSRSTPGRTSPPVDGPSILTGRSSAKIPPSATWWAAPSPAAP